MALKTYKARSCGMRFRESATFEEITEKKPVKRLTEAVRKTAGRNNQGRITTRHRGGASLCGPGCCGRPSCGRPS